MLPKESLSMGAVSVVSKQISRASRLLESSMILNGCGQGGAVWG